MTHTSPPPNPVRRAWPKPLLVLAVLYFLWLLWLAYVAWINVQSGNQ